MHILKKLSFVGVIITLAACAPRHTTVKKTDTPVEQAPMKITAIDSTEACDPSQAVELEDKKLVNFETRGFVNRTQNIINIDCDGNETTVGNSISKVDIKNVLEFNMSGANEIIVENKTNCSKLKVNPLFDLELGRLSLATFKVNLTNLQLTDTINDNQIEKLSTALIIEEGKNIINYTAKVNCVEMEGEEPSCENITKQIVLNAIFAKDKITTKKVYTCKTEPNSPAKEVDAESSVD